MALIPPFYLNCVVALGTANGEWNASGFLYGYRVGEGYCVYLVTNRHVVADQPRIVVRCNPSGRRPAREIKVDLQVDGKAVWFGPKSAREDVAVVPIDFAALHRRAQQVAFFRSDEHVALRHDLRRLGISEGDGAFVLGFPMGLVGGRRNAVIVRSGAVARVRDVIASVSNEVLIDALVFPGNSGGPVILKPEAIAIAGALSVADWRRQFLCRVRGRRRQRADAAPPHALRAELRSRGRTTHGLRASRDLDAPGDAYAVTLEPAGMHSTGTVEPRTTFSAVEPKSTSPSWPR